MDIGGIPLFQAIQRRLGWLNDRQGVLAQNVANVDTPDYVAQDLKPLSFRDAMGGGKRLALATTSGAHLAAVGSAKGNATLAVESGERKLSGNAVDLETEMMKVSDTASDYALVTNLYRKNLGLLKSALGRG